MKKDLTEDHIKEAMESVSLKDKDTLRKWLIETGRRYLIFDTIHLIDALAFPEGIGVLQHLIKAYGDYRRGLPSGDTKEETNEVTGEVCNVPIMLDEVMNREELIEVHTYIGELIDRENNK